MAAAADTVPPLRIYEGRPRSDTSLAAYSARLQWRMVRREHTADAKDAGLTVREKKIHSIEQVAGEEAEEFVELPGLHKQHLPFVRVQSVQSPPLIHI